MNFIGPKVKLSRKLGIALTPKAAKYMERKPYPPGQHGAKKKFRVSDYKKQLFEKQKLRYQYNINERQMRTYFHQASKMKGTTPENLVKLLESRLDAFVLRSGLARSIYAARQYVVHGHIMINGKKVDRPSYKLKQGQTVSVRERSKKLEVLHNAVKYASPPAYISLNKPGLSAQLLYIPGRDEVPVICNIILVIEFYSRK